MSNSGPKIGSNKPEDGQISINLDQNQAFWSHIICFIPTGQGKAVVAVYPFPERIPALLTRNPQAAFLFNPGALISVSILNLLT